MKNTSKKYLKEFGLLIGILFPLIIGFLLPFLLGHDLRFWTIWIGILFFLISFIYPKSLFYPYKFWVNLGNLIGGLNIRLIFGFVFLFVLIPISYIMRILGHDPMKKKYHKKPSYKESKENHFNNFRNMF